MTGRLLQHSLLVALVLVGAEGWAARSEDVVFLDGLRERGLYELAEAYCRRRLVEGDLAPRRKAELTVEWMQSLSEQAVRLPPAARGVLWGRAEAIADDFLAQRPANPFGTLVAFQAALVHLAHGELAREEATLAVSDAGGVDEARSELLAAIRRLELLAEEISKSPRGPEGQSLRADELAALGRNVQYQLARALQEQAQCFAAESPDRIHALRRAVRLFEDLAKLERPTDELGWKSRLGEVTCLGLLGERAEADKRLQAILALAPPEWVALQARARELRLALAAGEPGKLAALVEATASPALPTSAELDDARLEAAITLWQAAVQSGDAASTPRWQTEASRIVAQIQGRADPYWTRRAEMLLAGSLRAAAQSGDVQMLAQAARSSYLAGQTDEALAAYRRASDLAARQNDAAGALEYGRLAAAILQERGRHAEAMKQLRELALAYPDEPKAAAAHRAAIDSAAGWAKTGADGSLEAYADLLQEHLRRWPAGESAAQVRWWMGRLRQHQGDWTGAIAAYTSLGPGDPQFADAVAAVADCYEAWLAPLRAAGEPTGELAGRAASWLESVVRDASGEVPPGLDALGQLAVLRAARFWLDAPPEGFARAERLAGAALAGTPEGPAAWTSALGAALVAALAGQGRQAQADAVLQGISQAGPDALATLLEDLARVASGARPEVRKELAPLELRAIGMLGSGLGGLDEAEQRRIGQIHAQALADVGRVGEALQHYQALAARWPDDAAIQQGRARVLSAQQDRPALEEALAAWREVQRRSRAGTSSWFEAKYALAELQYRLGRPRQAEEIITLLSVVHPELGGPAMKTRFERLLARCRAQP